MCFTIELSKLGVLYLELDHGRIQTHPKYFGTSFVVLIPFSFQSIVIGLIKLCSKLKASPKEAFLIETFGPALTQDLANSFLQV